MSIVSVDNIQPIGSGTSVTVNKSVTLESGNTNITGVCTATSFSGSGANLTGVSQVGVLNQSDNRLITATGTTDSLYAEDLLTYDGTTLAAPKAEFSTTSPFSFIGNGATGTFNKTVVYANYNNTSNHVYNGILFDMGHLTDSGAGEVRKFTIGERGGPTNVTFDQNGIHFGHGQGNPTLGSTTGLDDYEEGAYEPTMTGSSGGSHTFQTYTHLAYTKIGRLVHIQGYININGGSLSGNLKLSLPFTVSNDAAGHSRYPAIGLSWRGHGWSANTGEITFAPQPNTTYGEFVSVTPAGAHTWINNTHVNNSYNIRIGGCYITNT